MFTFVSDKDLITINRKKTNMETTTYLASKPRYEILDGLRGVAAFIVVAFHLFETYSSGPVDQILNHGYLAVDFFSSSRASSLVMPTTIVGTA